MKLLKVKIAIYNLISFPLRWYRNKYIPPYEHVGWPPEEWIRDYERSALPLSSSVATERICYR